MSDLEAPFTYFGGKSDVTDLVWDRFGNDLNNYVEPFAGSLAVLLDSPYIPKLETVNDIDGFISNFWRAVSQDPEKVAEYAEHPVIENDLHARRRYMVQEEENLVEKLESDPEYYNAKIAGWWVWGKAMWIGKNFPKNKSRQKPHLTGYGKGVKSLKRRDRIEEVFNELQDRLKHVRVCCGDWSRVVTESVTKTKTPCGVFLDPPYSESANRDDVYANDDFNVGYDVHEWAIENGDDPELRIAVCGYEGEYDWPGSWEKVEWKAQGGYGNQGDENQASENRYRERIWFSPHCIDPNDIENTVFGAFMDGDKK